MDQAIEQLQEDFKNFKIVIFTKMYCPYSQDLKQLLKDMYINPELIKVYDVDRLKNGRELHSAMTKISGQ